jgi:hypothetical protein
MADCRLPFIFQLPAIRLPRMLFTGHFKGAKGYPPMPNKSIGKWQYLIKNEIEFSAWRHR